MRINKKRMSDAKSFRLRYLEKRAPKHDSNDFNEMLKDKINKLKIATNRDFDYTTKQNISKILRKLDGELSTSEKSDVVEMTENMLNKLPKYNNKVSDIIDEIHDLLDDCKLSMNDATLPRYIVKEGDVASINKELKALNSELEDMAWDEYHKNEDDEEGARLEDLSSFKVESNNRSGYYIANKGYGYFNELNSKNKKFIIGKLKDIADKYELKETKRRNNAEDSKNMKDEVKSKMRTKDDYNGYINGNIKDFNIDQLIDSIKKRKENLHVTLDGDNGYVYTILISGFFDSDAEKGEGMYVDIVQENKNTSNQKRILKREFNSWKEFKYIYNNFKRRMKFNKESPKMKRDAFVSPDVDARVSDWQDVLRIYLEWEGILGYNFIIEEYLEEKDFDGLREYLEDEGIYGYFDTIVDIYETGEVNIPDMDEEDYEKFF